MSPASVYAAYRSAEFTTLSQRDLIVKLYAGAERFLEEAATAMDAAQRDVAVIQAQKAKRIFVELLSTLDCERGGDIALRLRGLYVFFVGHISESIQRYQPQLLRELMPIVADLRGAWEKIPDELANAGSTEVADGHMLNIRT